VLARTSNNSTVSQKIELFIITAVRTSDNSNKVVIPHEEKLLNNTVSAVNVREH
jgi:hypothetical protein